MDLRSLILSIFPNPDDETGDRLHLLDCLGILYHHYAPGQNHDFLDSPLNIEAIMSIFREISKDFVLGSISYLPKGEELVFSDRGFERTIGSVHESPGHFYGELKNFAENNNLPKSISGLNLYGDFKFLVPGKNFTNRVGQAEAYFFVTPGKNYLKKLEALKETHKI